MLWFLNDLNKDVVCTLKIPLICVENTGMYIPALVKTPFTRNRIFFNPLKKDTFYPETSQDRARWIQHTKQQSLLCALQSGNFLICYECGIVWTLNPDKFFYPVTWQDPAQFFPMNIQDGSERNVTSFSFKSYNLCAVKPSCDYRTLQLSQTAAPYSQASFHVGRKNWTL